MYPGPAFAKSVLTINKSCERVFDNGPMTFTFVPGSSMLGINMLKAYYLDWDKNNKPLRQM